jgi:predicted transcriptional regulator
MNQFDNLLKHVQDLEVDFEKFYNNDNKAAGTRIRKGMQDLKEMAQTVRLEVQDQKNKAEAKPATKTTKK